jgi:uncharacterized membrane protein
METENKTKILDVSEPKESFFTRLSLKLADIFGSFPSLVIHIILIFLWLHYKLDIGTLTLILSIEAIFLSLFILTASNIELHRDRRNHSKDLKVDQKTLKRLTELLEIVHSIDERIGGKEEISNTEEVIPEETEE